MLPSLRCGGPPSVSSTSSGGLGALTEARGIITIALSGFIFSFCMSVCVCVCVSGGGVEDNFLVLCEFGMHVPGSCPKTVYGIVMYV